MLIPTKRGATYQDVLDAPENMRAELIDGDLYLQPRPRGSHQHALTELLGELRHPYRGGPRAPWVVLAEVELHIPFTLVPDLSGWRRERVSEPLDSPYFTVVPDWVCEVLSPSTRTYDRGLKARKYLERGVQHLWFVDPEEQALEVLIASGRGWLQHHVYEGSDVVDAPPFDGAKLELARLWSI